MGIIPIKWQCAKNVSLEYKLLRENERKMILGKLDLGTKLNSGKTESHMEICL